MIEGTEGHLNVADGESIRFETAGAGPDVSGFLLLDRVQTRGAIDPARLETNIRKSLISVSRNEVSAPPRIGAYSPTGILGTMPGYVPGLGLAAKLTTIFPVPGSEGRSRHKGIVALFDENTGDLLALMDAEAVTEARTAATATLALQELSDPTSASIAIIGSGAQARAQVEWLNWKGWKGPVVVGARDIGRAREVAALSPSATATNIREAVECSEAILCCTNASDPVISREWLSDGAYVSSVGGSIGPELDVSTIGDADVFVEWLGAVTSRPPAGAHELQDFDPSKATLLGTVLDDSHRDGRAAAELTVFKSTGHAVLDVAAAAAIYDQARLNVV